MNGGRASNLKLNARHYRFDANKKVDHEARRVGVPGGKEQRLYFYAHVTRPKGPALASSSWRSAGGIANDDRRLMQGEGKSWFRPATRPA